MENKETLKEINNTAKKEPKENKEKSSSSFTPPNENKHNDSRTNPNIFSRQNSAFKNLKNEIKSENIFPNGTPRKSLNNEYFNSIISPYKDYHFGDTPFKHTANYNITSPDNLRFNSPITGKFILFILNLINRDTSFR